MPVPQNKPFLFITVTDFSKQTGDYSSLSATDLRVMALAVAMEREAKGSTDHLRKEATMKPTVHFHGRNGNNNSNEKKGNNLPAGFYRPENDEDEENEEKEEVGQTHFTQKMKLILLTRNRTCSFPTSLTGATPSQSSP